MRFSRSSRSGMLCLVLVATLPATRMAAAQEVPEPRCARVDLPAGTAGVGSSARDMAHPIYALLAAWRVALREGNIEAVTALVTEDAEFWSPGTPLLRGRAAVGDAFRPFFARYEFLQEFECYELIIRGDLAVMRGLERNQLIPRAGGDTVAVQQRAFSILRRSADGQWRFARGMTNQPPGQ